MSAETSHSRVRQSALATLAALRQKIAADIAYREQARALAVICAAQSWAALKAATQRRVDNYIRARGWLA